MLDRYWLSTRAYASAADDATLDAIEPSIVAADMTLFVDVDELARRARLVARGMSDADLASLQDAVRLRARYRALLDSRVAGRGVPVDGSGMTIDEVVSAAHGAISRCAIERQLAMWS